ncbi:hypothetical protein LXL04_014199 [Taraxacum kok-saghyz]
MYSLGILGSKVKKEREGCEGFKILGELEESNIFCSLGKLNLGKLNLIKEHCEFLAVLLILGYTKLKLVSYGYYVVRCWRMAIMIKVNNKRYANGVFVCSWDNFRLVDQLQVYGPVLGSRVSDSNSVNMERLNCYHLESCNIITCMRNGYPYEKMRKINIQKQPMRFSSTGRRRTPVFPSYVFWGNGAGFNPCPKQ